jgi:hypothetical protein
MDFGKVRSIRKSVVLQLILFEIEKSKIFKKKLDLEDVVGVGWRAGFC